MSSISDPISDFLTRIRNASMAAKEEVTVPASKIKGQLAKLLVEEGYVEDYTLIPDKRQGLLSLKLKYEENGTPVIRELKRQSKPGQRIYVRSDRLPKVRNGLGTAIISTSRGVITDRQARKENIGGEYLCSIW